MGLFYTDNYNTRYRLFFSDIDGNPKRLDIDQKNYSGDIQNITGAKEPVIIKYNTGDIFKKFILSSKCTLNIYKMFDDELVEFHKFPEKEFKVRIYNGITPFQYHKLNLLARRTNIEKYTPDSNNYQERLTAIDGSFICDVVDDVVDNNFQKFATNKTKFINRILVDGGVIENEDSILANEISEVSDSYYQMYWQGYLVADTFKETLQPYPYKIQLTALDMLGTADNLKPNVYGSEFFGGAQSYGSNQNEFSNKYDMVDMLARYFLNGFITQSSQQSASPNLFGPLDSLYQYFFIEMDGRDNDHVISNIGPASSRNIAGFEDRFTSNFSQVQAGSNSNRVNTIGQSGIFDANYNVRKGKDIINFLLSYKNARLYQCWGQIVLAKIGTKNNIVENTADMINAVDGNMNMMYGLGPDIKNLAGNETSNITKYFKIARREVDEDEYGNTSQGKKTIEHYFGQPMLKKVRNDLQPIKKDFKVEYLAPLKELNLEVDRNMLNKVQGQVVKNPSFEYGGGYAINVGSFVVNDNPKSGRIVYKNTTFYIGNNSNALPTSGGGITANMQSIRRTFTSTTDHRIRVPIGKPKIRVSFDYYIELQNNATIFPNAKLFYFVELDTRETTSQNLTDFEYTYDQNDRRWEKVQKINFIELQDASSFNKWQRLSLDVDEWDLYNAQPDGISFLRARHGFLGLVIKSGTSSQFVATYIDNMEVELDLMYPKKDDVRLINTYTPNTKEASFKRMPWREINERGGGFDYEKDRSAAVDNIYKGNLIEYGTEILNLHSEFVNRYEFSVRNKGNDLNMANQLYINFEDRADDSVSYIDGLEMRVKSGENKLIAHKGALHEFNKLSVQTFTENLE